MRRRGNFPPGPQTSASAAPCRSAHDPLPLLLSLYEEHGPIFSVRLLHRPVVFMLGPEANHFVTVAHPENFHWRESSFGDLIPLLGDGLLTDRRRLPRPRPRDHDARLPSRADRRRGRGDGRRGRRRRSTALRPGQVVDVYEWMRELAMRIAMRALLGLDPDEAGKGAAAAEHFERALGFYGIDFHLRLLRGPGSPWSKMVASRAVLDEIVYGEIARRRADPDPEQTDILSLLIGVRDEAGEGFTDREVRDQVMTLMFAGHDTSTSTLTFMMHELARHPDVLARSARGAGRGARRRDARHRPARARDALPRDGPRRGPAPLPARLDRAAARRPRLRVRRLHRSPRGAYVNYCSWASHRIPEVFPDPEAFIPERFTRERKAALPRGAYVPFGGGRRICIGKRFGQTEVKLVATMLLQRLRLDAMPGRTMTVRQMPTLSPRGGLEMRVLSRG